MADVEADDDEDDGLDWSILEADGEAPAVPDPPKPTSRPIPQHQVAAAPHVPVPAVAGRVRGAAAVAEAQPAKRRRRKEAPAGRQARRDAGAEFHAKARLTDSGDASNEPKCVNLDREEGEEAVYLPVTINPFLKAHQLEGIRFLWTHIVRQPDPRLRGCVLAHSMGLGKTMQTVMFVYLFLRHQVGSRVLIVAPKSTLFSWADEAEGWCARCQLGRIRVRTLDDNCRRPEERREMVAEWLRCGGILLIGYEMFTLMSGVGRAKSKAKAREEDLQLFKEAFQDPGPDLVVCDEGHRLKNQKLLVMIALKSLSTTRRVVLTGTPLQNHLMEYYCMVDFVRESYWTRKEFRELFDSPIKAGQHDESTPEEVRVMKRRAYALSKELKAFVLRRDQSILLRELPPKHEFVLVVRLSPLQQLLCRNFVGAYSFQRRDTLYFTSMLNKICAHPDILRDYLSRVQKYGTGQKSKLNGFLDDAGIDLNEWLPSDDDDGEEGAGKPRGQRRKDDAAEEKDFSWAAPVLSPEYQDGILSYSSKMWVLQSIIDKCLRRGEKLLVFSMWTSVLDVMEKFLKSARHPLTWAQWQARCQRGQHVARGAGGPHPPTAGEMRDILMTLKWRRRDIEGVLQLWDDPRMKTLQECNDDQENELLGKLQADLQQQAAMVADQLDQGQRKAEEMFGREVLVEDDTCEAALRPFIGFCRIDGSTSSADRQTQIQEFNDPLSDKHVFLISTKAGGVGINLTAASRVVVFDVSWNPSDEAQAIFRTYRYGQTRPVMIYRLVAEGTPEEKIYDLKVGKEWLFKKIVDEMAPSRAFVKQNATLDTLFEYKEEEDFQHPQDAVSRMNRKVRCMNNDPLLTDVYAHNVQLIRKMFPHESLLVDDFGEHIDDAEMAASLAEYQHLRYVHAVREAQQQQLQQQHSDALSPAEAPGPGPPLAGGWQPLAPTQLARYAVEGGARPPPAAASTATSALGPPASPTPQPVAPQPQPPPQPYLATHLPTPISSMTSLPSASHPTTNRSLWPGGNLPLGPLTSPTTRIPRGLPRSPLSPSPTSPQLSLPTAQMLQSWQQQQQQQHRQWAFQHQQQQQQQQLAMHRLHLPQPFQQLPFQQRFPLSNPPNLSAPNVSLMPQMNYGAPGYPAGMFGPLPAVPSFGPPGPANGLSAATLAGHAPAPLSPLSSPPAPLSPLPVSPNPFPSPATPTSQPG